MYVRPPLDIQYIRIQLAKMGPWRIATKRVLLLQRGVCENYRRGNLRFKKKKRMFPLKGVALANK